MASAKHALFSYRPFSCTKIQFYRNGLNDEDRAGNLIPEAASPETPPPLWVVVRCLSHAIVSSGSEVVVEKRPRS